MNIDEELKKFTEGFAYKAPEYTYNRFRDLPPLGGKVRVIADNPEEQHLADQLTKLINEYKKNYDN